MATQTTYYNFNKPIGTDLVNPLTDQIPNWDLADAALHGLSVNSIGTATEVVSGTVHALTRLAQSDAKFIQFIATGDYDSGDTFTLDGVAIGATYPDGTSLETDAYATGATVLIGLNSDDSVATFYLSKAGSGTAPDSDRLGGELPAYYASKSYADGIKSTADAAASAIAKKALVNVYADSSGKLYKVLADGSQGGEITIKSPTWVSLWSDSVTSRTAFTQSIDLSDYKEIYIAYVENSNANPKIYGGEIIPVISGHTTYGTLTGGASSPRLRRVTVDTSGVSFANGYAGDSAAGNWCSPFEIYGHK